MEKNGVISLRLEDLVEMLDARKSVNIFISERRLRYDFQEVNRKALL